VAIELMVNIFENLVASHPLVDMARASGYSVREIDAIEQIYGWRIQGELRQFLMLLGRCTGGLLGDTPIILYKQFGVRDHLETQWEFQNELRQLELVEFRLGPVLFSIEHETQYYFLQTGAAEFDMVYHLDTNSSVVLGTGLTLFEYMERVAAEYSFLPRVSPRFVRGELLPI
jgi:hypothetical protein